MSNVQPSASVLKFAQEYGNQNGVKFVMVWRDYNVFMPDYSDENDAAFGLPQFILQKDNILRWAKHDEQEELIHLISKID